MTPTPNNIIVKFDYNKADAAVKQASGLYIPERYQIEESDEQEEMNYETFTLEKKVSNSAWGVTTNRSLINPQIVKILSGEHTGERAFVYYGAFELAKWLDDDCAVIPENSVFFLIDPIRMMPGFYLGDEIIKEGLQTESGIWTTSNPDVKETVKIKITHVPENCLPGVHIGSVIITIDGYQYPLNFYGEKHIKLKDSEIVGVII